MARASIFGMDRLPAPPKLPSDLATLIGFDGADRSSYNALARAIHRADMAHANTILDTSTATVRPRRKL